MKKILLFSLHLLTYTFVFPQAAPIPSIGTLASVINESSGIEQTAPNVFFSHNDSGGQPDLYKIDSLGTLGPDGTQTPENIFFVFNLHT